MSPSFLRDAIVTAIYSDTAFVWFLAVWLFSLFLTLHVKNSLLFLPFFLWGYRRDSTLSPFLSKCWVHLIIFFLFSPPFLPPPDVDSIEYLDFPNFGIIMDSNSISAQMVLSVTSVSTVVIYTSYTYTYPFGDWNLSHSLLIHFSFISPFQFSFPLSCGIFFLVCLHASLLFGSVGFYFPGFSSRVVFTFDIAVSTTRISNWAFR